MNSRGFGQVGKEKTEELQKYSFFNQQFVWIENLKLVE